MTTPFSESQPEAPQQIPVAAPDAEPQAPPTVLGLMLRVVVVWLSFVAISAAILIPLEHAQPYVAIPIALLGGGIGRAIMGNGRSWLAILAIPTALGLMAGLLFASPMLTLVMGERVAVTTVEFSDGNWCTVQEVDGDRTWDEVLCGTNNRRWEVGSVHELAVGGPLPHTYDSGSPWEADKLEKTFGWVLPALVGTFVLGLLLRFVHVWRTYWRRQE